jgi:protein-S-isoprenylcysteine O-methyltransferase Ste14
MTRHFDRLGKEVFRLRGGLWTALYLVILLFARPEISRLMPALLLVLAGQAIRFWGVGCIVRYRGEQVKAEHLTTWGPFAWIRNPLYFGNGLIGLGWSYFAGPAVVALFALSFVLIYPVFIIPHEEAFLEKQFGQAFRDYRSRTPRLFPWKIVPPNPVGGPFRKEILWTSERHTLWVTLAGSLLLFSRLWW